MSVSLEWGSVFTLCDISTRGINRTRKNWSCENLVEAKVSKEYPDFYWFVKFYQQFIKDFTKIAGLLSSMFKILLITLDLASNEKNSSRKPDVTKANFFKVDFVISQAQIAFI